MLVSPAGTPTITTMPTVNHGAYAKLAAPYLSSICSARKRSLSSNESPEYKA
jgi:hypothetical protein